MPVRQAAPDQGGVPESSSGVQAEALRSVPGVAPSMSKQVLMETLVRLEERRDALETEVIALEGQLDSKRAAVDETIRAINAQRAAIELFDRPPKRARRPGATRPPAEGSQGWKILEAFQGWDRDTMSLGVIGTRSGLPSTAVRQTISGLVERGYLDRIEAGLYRRTDKPHTTQEGDQG